MYYLDYNKILQYLDGPFGGVDIVCFHVGENKICVKVSDNIYNILCEKYSAYEKKTHKLKKEIANNSYYYLNYLNYDKIKNSTEGDIKVFCYFNGNTHMCVSENNKQILNQLEAWYNSTHDVTKSVIIITKEIEIDYEYY